MALDKPRTNSSRKIRRRALMGMGAMLGVGAASFGGLLDITPGPKASAAASPRTGGRIIFGAPQDIDILDPHLTVNKGTRDLLGNIFEPLVCYRPGDFRAYPCLAESWEVSSDLRSYTFRLRRDIKFHDGTPLDAAAVKFSFDRIASPEASRGVAQASLGPYDATDVVSPNTVRVRFKEPYSSFLILAGDSVFSPVSPTAVRRLGKDFGFQPVGTGPFRFKEWIQHNSVTITRNPDYKWASSTSNHTGPAYLDEVVWRIVPEAATRVGLVESGEAHIVEQPNYADLERLQRNQRLEIFKTIPAGSPYGIYINVEHPPTDELAVRQAILYAINKEPIVKIALRGFSEAAFSPLQPTMEAYDKSLANSYPYDSAKARNILDGAGWRMGPDGIRTKANKRLVLEQDMRADGGFDEINPLVQAQLRAIGCDVQLRTVAQSVYAQVIAGLIARNLIEIRWWYPDPNLLGVMFASKSYNASRLKDENLNRILALAQTINNPSRREILYHQAQEIVMRDAAILPVAVNLTLFGLAKNLKGFATNNLGFPLFHGIAIG